MTEWKQRELKFRGYIKTELYGKLQASGVWKYKKEQVAIINGIASIDDYDLELNVERNYVQRVQYTGEKDINGKKIFEGDICIHQGAVGYIKFDSDSNNLAWALYEKGWDGNLCFILYPEIIGNVFQNLELVEKYKLEIK